jgi:hypothetical protein
MEHLLNRMEIVINYANAGSRALFLIRPMYKLGKNLWPAFRI